MNAEAEHERLDAEFAEAVERDDARDDRRERHRCPACGGRTVETRSTANRRCERCGALVGREAAA